MRVIRYGLVLLVAVLALAGAASAQQRTPSPEEVQRAEDLKRMLLVAQQQPGPEAAADMQRLRQLDTRLNKLESRFEKGVSRGVVFFLFGAFCALWAQNTKRSAWLWFFLGLFFNVFAVLVLLYKNSEDAPARPAAS